MTTEDTLYKGFKTTDGGPQLVWKTNGSSIPVVLGPGPSQEVMNHSPDGFQWGYGGSGPSQLALAILLDVTGDPDLSVRLHQTFKNHFVASWSDKWQIRNEDILTWIEENREAA